VVPSRARTASSVDAMVTVSSSGMTLLSVSPSARQRWTSAIWKRRPSP
jgi:hypothetical protein